MYKAPDYCPDAIATDTGWVNPRNGELLVAVKQLKQKIADQAVIVETLPIEELVEILPVIEENIIQVDPDAPKDHVMTIEDVFVTEEELPMKRRPGRPKSKK